MEDNLKQLSDSPLLAVCDATMNASEQTELSELLAQNREGPLDPQTRQRLESLMRDYQRGLLRKARAWRIAVARGLRSSLE